jgi:hypothetical protein
MFGFFKKQSKAKDNSENNQPSQVEATMTVHSVDDEDLVDLR